MLGLVDNEKLESKGVYTEVHWVEGRIVITPDVSEMQVHLASSWGNHSMWANREDIARAKGLSEEEGVLGEVKRLGLRTETVVGKGKLRKDEEGRMVLSLIDVRVRNVQGASRDELLLEISEVAGRLGVVVEIVKAGEKRRVERRQELRLGVGVEGEVELMDGRDKDYHCGYAQDIGFYDWLGKREDGEKVSLQRRARVELELVDAGERLHRRVLARKLGKSVEEMGEAAVIPKSRIEVGRRVLEVEMRHSVDKEAGQTTVSLMLGEGDLGVEELVELMGERLGDLEYVLMGGYLQTLWKELGFGGRVSLVVALTGNEGRVKFKRVEFDLDELMTSKGTRKFTLVRLGEEIRRRLAEGEFVETTTGA